MSKLVIVESPTKAKTIGKFLGREFHIESSYGHIRDLPKSKMGIDLAHDFQPEYVIPAEAKKRVATLKNLAKKSAEVILATDEDREGEAISWHLAEALGLNRRPEQIKRIVFHEITKTAIEDALQNPRAIDLHLVDAQQARRILDRLVGYELSPFLWKKVKRGLSAGRVQSVALRLVVEREREIEKFKPTEYWGIEAKLKKPSHPDPQAFVAKLVAVAGKPLKKFAIPDQTHADEIVKQLENTAYQVATVKTKETRRYPAPPFTTSTLQQEAARKLGLSAKQTMLHAQKLYETGHITYMRTDSVNLAEQALHQAHAVIAEIYGPTYALPAPRRYKTKSRGAQEAHEAIRPTDLAADPGTLGGGMEKKAAQLYELIWKRTIASQMPEAIFDQTTADIAAGQEHLFRATGQVMKFDGFIKVYTEGRDDNGESQELPEGQLPELAAGDDLKLLDLAGRQHFTEPPPRFTDATLVKALEEYGIGRPSTYAPTISTIMERGYVQKVEKKFQPTHIGLVVNDLLVAHFPQIVDYRFTARMEDELDDIAAGQLAWQPVIREFYDPFKSNLEQKKDSVEKHVEQTDIPCPICGKPMVKKFGRYGQFLACADYPACKGTKPLPEEEAKLKKLESENGGKKCPACALGELVVRRGKFGYFLGCNRYPECKHLEKIEKKTGVTCPQCALGELVEKRTRKGRTFWGCNRYPECDYATWQYPGREQEQKKEE